MGHHRVYIFIMETLEGEARKRKRIGKVEEGEKEVGREGGGKEDRWS